MSEHDDRYAGSDLPRTTGEFRAAPDISASTAEFKAFVANQEREGGAQRGGAGGLWPEQPAAGEAPRSNPGNRTIAIVAAAAVVVIIIVLIVALG
jgi:hypothetical protein